MIILTISITLRRIYSFPLFNRVVAGTFLQYLIFIPAISITVKISFINMDLCLKLNLFLCGYFLLFNIIWIFLLYSYIIFSSSNSYLPLLGVISRERSALNLILSMDLTPHIRLLLVNWRRSYNNALNIDINLWVCKFRWWSVNLFKFHQSIPSNYLTSIT